jgi:hypothetical protein
VLAMLVGIGGWLVSVIIGVWYLTTVREMRDELRTIRRYLQAMHEQQKLR